MRGAWLFLLFLVAHAQFCMPPEVEGEFIAGCVPGPMLTSMLNAETSKVFSPNPPGEGGPEPATARIWQIINDAVVTGDQIMHAIIHNSNTRDTGDDFQPLPHRVTGEMPPSFPANYKAIMGDGGASACSQALSFYGATAGSNPCNSFLTYIGAPLTITRDTVMHALIHNSNVRDTLANFLPLPHTLTGLKPSGKFPTNYAELMDPTQWPETSIAQILQFYNQTPLSGLPAVQRQLLEYIGAPVTIHRDNATHSMIHNYNARDLRPDFQPLPNALTGFYPTIPFPASWDQILSGVFNVDQIKALLTFYNQTLVSENLSDLQIQLLEYIGGDIT